MITRTINTMDELLDFTKELHEKHDDTIWYRGEENSTLALIPSIQRSEKRIGQERFLANEFYIRAKQILENAPDRKNYAVWVSLMQHHGLPTRMLDWSQSPLIAAFFATERQDELPERDACIWVLVPKKLNEQEGFGDCIYPLDANTAQEMLRPAFKHLNHNPKLTDKILCCYSVEKNLRMYSQQSCFTVHNSIRRLEDICDESMLYKMIIPSGRRRYFIESLRSFGITESFVYPDMDHISSDLLKTFDL